MQSKAETVDAYLAEVPDERRPYFDSLRKAILDNIPKGFVEQMNYGMIGYVVPHSLFPDGYHCNPKLPLPFANIASQKHFIGFYHMGMYADKRLLDWFVTEYPNHTDARLDMGKSCVRFKKFDQIPFDLIGELMQMVTVEDWINTYKNSRT